MKTKSLTLEQLIQENKQELLADEEQIAQIEKRLEKKRTGLLRDKQKT